MERKRSKGVYIYWGVALTLLLTLGLFCWLVVVPVWQVRDVARRTHGRLGLETSFVLGGLSLDKGVTELGGAKAAAPKLSLYLRMPLSVAPHPEAAVLMLISCGESSRFYLMRFLRHEHPGVRARIADVLGRIEVPGRVEALIAALRDPDARTRWMAAASLAKIKPPLASDALISVLGDENASVRMWAVAALESIECRSAVPSIIPLLADKDEDVRRSAAQALGVLGNYDVVVHLEKLLQDKSPDVRHDAARALKKIKAAQEKK